MGSIRRRLKSGENAIRRIASGTRLIQTSEHQPLAFVFLGEFGYELLNWHARIRRYQDLHPDTPIVAVSRAATQMLYPSASVFVALDGVPGYQSFAADGYFARFRGTKLNSVSDIQHARELRRGIVQYLHHELGPMEQASIVFSDGRSLVNGFPFGVGRYSFGHDASDSDIYHKLRTDRNHYFQLEASPSSGGHHLASDRILVMRAARRRITRFREVVSDREIIRQLASTLPVALMEFQSNRWDDTQGSFASDLDIAPIVVRTLKDQVEAIQAARLCLFFTEGDFRSHTYVPPLCGKDVYVLGESALFGNGDVPRWNREVFTFGGQVRPLALETFDPAFGGERRLIDLMAHTWVSAGRSTDSQ